MNEKFITIQLPNGYAKIRFIKLQKDGNWICTLPDETMGDLEACIEGKPLKERVNWIDLGGLGE